MIDTNRPDMTPDLLIHKLQNEIHAHSLNLSSTSSRSAYRQSKLEYVNTILNDALMLSQVRIKLPQKLSRLPILKNTKVQRILLKVYNFLFKEQRAINLGIIQAVRENINLNQQLADQTINLENYFQGLNASIDDRLTNLDDRCKDIETHLSQEFTSLASHLSAAERTIQFIEKNHSDRLRYLQTDLAQQKQLTTLLLKEQHGLLNPEIYSTPETSFLHSTRDIQSLQGDRQIDSFYSAFEDKFRGNRSLIRERLQIYLPFLKESDIHQSGDEILDIGSGRGEWLELLRDEGYQGRGLDINQAMIQQCKEIGLSIVEGDALTYLKSLPDNTLGGITGFHIVEHLPFESLIQLMIETYRVVRPNGLIIFETPNPRNVIVGSCTFYTDPTHKNPIPPEVLQFMVNYSGFEKSQILLLNPSQDIPVLENSAIADRFNELFYGCMDYAVIGTKG